MQRVRAHGAAVNVATRAGEGAFESGADFGVAEVLQRTLFVFGVDRFGHVIVALMKFGSAPRYCVVVLRNYPPPRRALPRVELQRHSRHITNGGHAAKSCRLVWVRWCQPLPFPHCGKRKCCF
ncbi:hypothetical protein ACFSUI_10965 [Ralstonia solanacearum]